MTIETGRRSDAGFTLVEVMVVVVVLAVLVAIGLPMFMGAKVKAEERAAQAQLRTGLTAGLTYWTDGATFTAFDASCTATPGECDVAEDVEDSVAWVGAGPPAAHEISILFAAGNNLLLVSRADSGGYFCLAQSTGQTDRGRAPVFDDVDTLVECAGGW